MANRYKHMSKQRFIDFVSSGEVDMDKMVEDMGHHCWMAQYLQHEMKKPKVGCGFVVAEVFVGQKVVKKYQLPEWAQKITNLQSPYNYTAEQIVRIVND